MGKGEVVFQTSSVIIENAIAPIVKSVAEKMNAPLTDAFLATKDHPKFFPAGVHLNRYAEVQVRSENAVERAGGAYLKNAPNSK